MLRNACSSDADDAIIGMVTKASQCAEVRVLDCGSVVHVRSHTGVACTVAYCGVKIALLPLPAAAPHAGQLIMASLSLIVEINWSYCCSFPCEKS